MYININKEELCRMVQDKQDEMEYSTYEAVEEVLNALVIENAENEEYVDSGWEANGNKLYFKGEIGY